MLRTISLKLETTLEQNCALQDLQKLFNRACNTIAAIAKDKRYWNRTDLHKLSYYRIRHSEDSSQLGSQMVCNAIASVCEAYKALKIKKSEDAPIVTFRQNSSIHFDKKTYSLKGDSISLYTLTGRLPAQMNIGEFQRNYLQTGKPKEAELLCKKGQWYFNLVIEIADPTLIQPNGEVLGVDLGENNLATTSTGKIFGGGKLRHERDQALALRKKLQSNGSESSKQLLQKISGREARHVKYVNHVISKAIIKEAQDNNCVTIAMEALTNIRKRIKAGKRLRSRLHRWSWAQLQMFIAYKAQAAGLNIMYVNPAYTSQTCAECHRTGTRNKHRFVCNFCGIQRHSDLNASQNIRRIAASADTATGTVNCPHVAIT